MGDIFICPLCGNQDKKYIGYLNNKPYCRRCIQFVGENYDKTLDQEITNTKTFINYELSKEQKEISSKVLDSFINKKNTLIYAVCGSGKTELVFKVIEYSLKKNLKVGFAIPRKDVVIELKDRLSQVFKNNKVISIYGGNTKDLNGDITVLTTHQLYRFEKVFDLLILDEIDAFPYKDNIVLENIFKRSVKGNYILMSATPSKKLLDDFKKNKDSIFTLFKRYHEHPLPIPKIKIIPSFLRLFFLIDLLNKYKKENKKVFIFVSSIEKSKTLFEKLHVFVKNGNYVNSKRENRNEIIKDFKSNKYFYLVTTQVLERGVTVPNLQVIIFDADSEIYDSPALIQVSGRVGRKKEFPNGDVIYLCDQSTKDMEDSINEIKRYNTML